MNMVNRYPAFILGLLGLFSFGRGLFHFFAPDSGAGSVAGMNLSFPNGADVVFLLAAAGVLQAALGALYFYIALYARQMMGFVLTVEVVRVWAFVIAQYTFKMPANPVPGRYAHIAVGILALSALIVYLYPNRTNNSSPSS